MSSHMDGPLSALERNVAAAEALATLHRSGGLDGLPDLMLQVARQVEQALDSLRKSRSALEDVAHERLGLTKQKLAEVSSTTEGAATSILDGLDRLTQMLDAADAMEDPAAMREAHDQMRMEVFDLMGHMQFQDITSQQLSHTNSVLGDLERRLDSIRKAFDGAQSGEVLEFDEQEEAEVGAFDPAATMGDAENRQSLVDEIFGT